MTKTYDFISDPGHGWLKVPLFDLAESGATNQISQFSYLTKEHAYLEEDCDAGAFIEAQKKRGINIAFNEKDIPDFRLLSRQLGMRRFPGYCGDFAG